MHTSYQSHDQHNLMTSSLSANARLQVTSSCCYVPCSRFTSPEDYQWFTKTMGRVINEEFGEDSLALVESTHYFVDFLRYSLRGCTTAATWRACWHTHTHTHGSHPARLIPCLPYLYNQHVVAVLIIFLICVHLCVLRFAPFFLCDAHVEFFSFSVMGIACVADVWMHLYCCICTFSAL